MWRAAASAGLLLGMVALAVGPLAQGGTPQQPAGAQGAQEGVAAGLATQLSILAHADVLAQGTGAAALPDVVFAGHAGAVHRLVRVRFGGGTRQITLQNSDAWCPDGTCRALFIVDKSMMPQYKKRATAGTGSRQGGDAPLAFARSKHNPHLPADSGFLGWMEWGEGWVSECPHAPFLLVHAAVPQPLPAARCRQRRSHGCWH